MAVFTDQLNRKIELIKEPQRIISVVPSQTELLFELQLEERITGITKFCIHPEHWFRNKTRIGGTKTLNLEKIRSLKPDLILANKEENVQEQIEILASEFPVWVSDVNNLQQALEMIECIGQITGTSLKAKEISDNISNAFTKALYESERLPKTCYLIWKDPYMTVGGDTFIHDMLVKAGFNNLFSTSTRYPTVTIEELKMMNCEVLLLSSEPYPFKQKHIDELQKHLPSTIIILVDGEMFSWYGSRLLKAPAYFQQLRQQVKAIS